MRLVLYLLALAALVTVGCPESTPVDGDADGDVDSDTDVDGDVDSDSDGDVDSDSDGDADSDVDGDVCIPDCAGRECGSDSCGGRCRPGCNPPDECDEGTGDCFCIPDCEGRECGADGCGATCGLCPDGEMCNAETGHCGEVTSCDGGWFDPSSGLCWQNPSEDAWRDWYEAVAYCDGLDLGGYGPGSWRLPTISELRSLIRGCPKTETGGECGVTDSCLGDGCWNYNCWECAFEGGPGAGGAYWPTEVGGPGRWYWSSSSYAGVSSLAWRVTFYDGFVSADLKSYSYYVRCVRGGP